MVKCTINEYRTGFFPIKTSNCTKTKISPLLTYTNYFPDMLIMLKHLDVIVKVEDSLLRNVQVDLYQ